MPDDTPADTRGDRRRRELIAAACRLLADKGFEGLRVRDVAEGAGVNIATLHYYFPEKEALIIGVVEHILQSFIASNPLHQKVVPHSAVDQIRAVVANQEKRIRDNPETYIILTEITSRAHRNSAIQAKLAEMEAGWRAFLGRLIVAGHADGSIPSHIDPVTTASLLTAVIRGVNIQTVYGLDTPDFPSIIRAVGRIIGASED